MTPPLAPFRRIWKDEKDAKPNPADPDYNCWAPLETYKRELLRWYGKEYGLRTFIETGSYEGDTISALHESFDNVYSIEIKEWHYNICMGLFSHLPNVHLYCGDSGVILREILSSIPNTPTLFWLDAHSARESPLQQELEAIFDYREKGAILIDDMQEFWLHDWRSIVERFAALHSDWQFELKDGIVRLVKA